jgi:hypothetical protein
MKKKLFLLGLAFLPGMVLAWDHPAMNCRFSSSHGAEVKAIFPADQNKVTLKLGDVAMTVEASNPTAICPAKNSEGKMIFPPIPPASQYIFTIEKGDLKVSSEENVASLVRAPKLTLGDNFYWGDCQEQWDPKVFPPVVRGMSGRSGSREGRGHDAK